MANPRLIGINTAMLPEGQDIILLSELTKSILLGTGAISSFASKLEMNAAAPLRMMIGLPKIDLKATQKKLVEIFVCLHYNSKMEELDKIWTTKPTWQPMNKHRIPARISDCRLDTDYVMSFGIRPCIWDEHVFMADNVLVRAKSRSTHDQENIRNFMALSLFGFPRPEEFFTAAKDAV